MNLENEYLRYDENEPIEIYLDDLEHYGFVLRKSAFQRKFRKIFNKENNQTHFDYFSENLVKLYYSYEFDDDELRVAIHKITLCDKDISKFIPIKSTKKETTYISGSYIKHLSFYEQFFHDEHNRIIEKHFH